MSPQASIIDINESNLQQTLEQSMQLPVLFYFWSERSQHCQDLTPVLERLAQEYEIHDRQLALERKLRLISDTAQTLLDMLQTQRTLRVEWYIVILIVVEIVLTLYELFLH